MTTSFPLILHKTYYNNGYFNVPVDFGDLFGNHAIVITIVVEPEMLPFYGKINRKATKWKIPRIMGTVRLRDWFQDNFEQGDIVEVEIKSPQLIHIRKL